MTEQITENQANFQKEVEDHVEDFTIFLHELVAKYDLDFETVDLDLRFGFEDEDEDTMAEDEPPLVQDLSSFVTALEDILEDLDMESTTARAQIKMAQMQSRLEALIT